MENTNEGFILFYFGENDENCQFELWKVDKNFYKENIQPYKYIILKKKAVLCQKRVCRVVQYFETAEDVQLEIANVCSDFLDHVDRFAGPSRKLDVDTGIPLVFMELVSLSNLRNRKNAGKQSRNFSNTLAIQSKKKMKKWIENWGQNEQLERQFDAPDPIDLCLQQIPISCTEFIYKHDPILEAKLELANQPFFNISNIDTALEAEKMKVPEESYFCIQNWKFSESPVKETESAEAESDKEAETRRWIQFLKVPQEDREEKVTIDDIVMEIEDKVVIKINHTEIPKATYNDENTWKNYTKATRKLMLSVFEKDTLSFHALSESAFEGNIEKEIKPQLDIAITNDIIILVSFKMNIIPSLVRRAIVSLCADCAKSPHSFLSTQQGLKEESVKQTQKTFIMCSEKESAKAEGDKEAETRRWIQLLKVPQEDREEKATIDDIVMVTGDKVIIKLNNTEMPRIIYEDEKTWKTYTKATKILMLSVFTKNTLSTHTLSGNAFKDATKTELKPQLNIAKTNDVIILVSFKTNTAPGLVRKAILSLCADCAKTSNYSQSAKRRLMEKSVRKTQPIQDICYEKESAIKEPEAVKAEGGTEEKTKRLIELLRAPKKDRMEKVTLDDILIVTEDKVIIKINNTKIPKVIYEEENTWKSYTKVTRKLMLSVFTKNTLSNHTFSGSALKGAIKKKMKHQLDVGKMNDVVILVSVKTNTAPNLVRRVITSLCADFAKSPRNKVEQNYSV